MTLLHILLQSLSTVFFIYGRTSSALTMNRTIDDQLGDDFTKFVPRYSPQNAWMLGPNCTGCLIGTKYPVNTSKVFNGTWHDVSAGLDPQPKTITLEFTGTAIYVFNMVDKLAQPQYEGGPFLTQNNISFELDDAPEYTLFRAPGDLCSEFICYNVLTYSQTGLANVNHSLLITCMVGNCQFDYALYTFSDDRPEVSFNSSTSDNPSVPSPPSAYTLSGASSVPVRP
ncbi:uncharacterized protein BXZ73DRAFT_46905 [Epithele typhae]|uniref:uncharacterized protein n=1 Tax=Epithele typhae TaxID=378194 RepID=UPI002007740E|nr:uncharacterized protein BXZ73DRAFT_46905 [Epithele typhae]KAH9932125.1 hypothetical protein BXZ73DRAFT_46905 [Epithele typhae]